MARTITIELQDDQYARLERRAQRRGVSVTQLAREQLGDDEEHAGDVEATVHQALVEAGLLADAARPVFDAQSFGTWTPLVVDGRPVSECLIEDRR